jgi:hypothetical protein
MLSGSPTAREGTGPREGDSPSCPSARLCRSGTTAAPIVTSLNCDHLNRRGAQLQMPTPEVPRLAASILFFRVPDELQSLTLEPWGAPFEVRRYTFECVHPEAQSPLRNLIINIHRFEREPKRAARPGG